jgi:hypothetical protein
MSGKTLEEYQQEMLNLRVKESSATTKEEKDAVAKQIKELLADAEGDGIDTTTLRKKVGRVQGGKSRRHRKYSKKTMKKKSRKHRK